MSRPSRSVVPARRHLVLTIVLAAAGAGGACGGGNAAEGPELSPLATEGRQVAVDAGCTACHGPQGEGGVGPSWVGLAGSEVTLEDGSIVLADTEYLHRAITDPAAQVVADATIAMPRNALTTEEVDAVVAYIEELSDEGTEG